MSSVAKSIVEPRKSVRETASTMTRARFMTGCSNSLGHFSVSGDGKTIMDRGVLVLESALLCELHFILISMAAARLDRDSQGRT
jgi:hypothetical protein